MVSPAVTTKAKMTYVKLREAKRAMAVYGAASLENVGAGSCGIRIFSSDGCSRRYTPVIDGSYGAKLDYLFFNQLLAFVL